MLLLQCDDDRLRKSFGEKSFDVPLLRRAFVSERENINSWSRCTT